MKHKIYYLLLTVAPAVAIAQPTVPNALNYSVGATVKNIRCNDIGPGGAGANQTWDFSSLTPVGGGKDTAKYWYVAPGSNAPVSGANIVEKNSDSFYVYAKKSASQDEVLAIADSSAGGQNFTVKYTNSMLFFKRPLTFGMTFTDEFTEQYTVQTFTLKGRGKDTVTVDGWGTLKLPGGATYNNVLRVEIKQHQSDTVQFLNSVARLDAIRYLWFDDKHISPLLRIDAVEITSDAINNSTSYAEYLHFEHDPANVENMQHGKMEFSAAFNNNTIALAANFSSGKSYDLVVYNMSGQRVYANTFIANSTRQAFDLNSDTPSGVYLVTVAETGTSNTSIVKVSKQ
jgi:hypothetical protein